MLEAAAMLRRTALGMRRLVAHPLAAQVLAVLLEEPGKPCRDPGRLAAGLADQAVDVVTALDYLIYLLHTPAAGEEDLDRLTRRRLDARAAAVRQGVRLLAMQPAGLLIAAGQAGDGPVPGATGDRQAGPGPQQ
jgi:hypothetical protein